MTAQEIINSALKQAHPFIGPQEAAKGVLLDSLSSLDEQVIQWIVTVNNDLIAKEVDTVTIATALNADGYTLKLSPTYRDFKYINKDGDVTPIRLVLPDDIDNPGAIPAGAIEANVVATLGPKFRPADPLRKRWATAGARAYYKGDGDTISYRYVPQTSQLTALSDDLVSPATARPFLIASVVLDILLRAQGVPPTRLQAAVQGQEKARQAMVMVVHKQVLPSPSPATQI